MDKEEEKRQEAASPLYCHTKLSILPSAWRVSSIGAVGAVVTGNTPSTSEKKYFSGDRLFITPSDFHSGIYIRTSGRTVSDEAYKVSRVNPPNSIYVVCIGATVGKINICKEYCICNQQINAIVPNSSNNTLFLYYCVDYFFNRSKKKYIGQQTLPIVSKSQFSRIQLALPPLSEQRKIATILATQDKVIELYERKIEQLQLLKKNCLRKMFPRHGSDTPEVRFRGFTGTWERKRLGDLCHFSKGYGYSKSDLKPSGKPIILYGRLYTRHETEIVEVDTFAEANNESVYSRGGDVIVPASGETAEDISIASVVKQTGVIIGGDINIIKPESALDSTFLAISISNAKPHDDIARMAQGKSVVHLHCGDLEKVVLSYPCHSEQMRISAFFRHIDSTITLNQRRCDGEKQKKKALMQLLLTGLVRVGEAAGSRLKRAGNEAAGSRFPTRIAKT